MADIAGCINRIVITNNLPEVDSSDRWTLDASVRREYGMSCTVIECGNMTSQIMSYLIGKEAQSSSGGTLKESNYEPGKLQVLRDAQKDNQDSLDDLLKQLVKIKSALMDSQ